MEHCRHELPDLQDPLLAFVASARAGDTSAMRVQVARGFDVNGYDELGDTILQHLIAALEFSPALRRQQVVSEMLRLGADPGAVGRDGASPLFQAAMNMDSGVLRILLDAGADPNAMLRILAGAAGGSPQAGGDRRCEQSLYDWASFAYCYEVWRGRLPADAGTTDGKGEEAWLDDVDRLAVSYGRRRPEHLRLLRERGALRLAELRQRAEAGMPPAAGEWAAVGAAPRRRRGDGVAGGQERSAGCAVGR
ncbi:MAG: hypothetical protein FAZ92_02888 [Accumulibacter sp.]|uniref:ankyrin repeat domain-containing protein n=1 Tax=Accumulibacter sp. TaxID=2053492 RepID=UPI001212204A|nr:ankyrin repeat domain-containing protein [Accumulibacter sp.]TLD44865.1 MAG: hypothetical protein FAZ92_02888 [Accumulibacter sp.]